MPVPPRAIAKTPVQPKVKFWAVIDPVTLVSLVIPWTTLAFKRAAARVPVKAGLKVQVEVPQTMESKRLVSVDVEKVMFGEKVATPPAVRVEEARTSERVFPVHDKLDPAVI